MLVYLKLDTQILIIDSVKKTSKRFVPAVNHVLKTRRKFVEVV